MIDKKLMSQLWKATGEITMRLKQLSSWEVWNWFDRYKICKKDYKIYLKTKKLPLALTPPVHLVLLKLNIMKLNDR